VCVCVCVTHTHTHVTAGVEDAERVNISSTIVRVKQVN
jgi:hypothetical protein